MTEEIKKLKELIDGTDNIVFFGGAGVSTESGIPDFRSVDGLYHQQWDDPPETILSHTYYERYPEKFFAFYRAKLLCDTPDCAFWYSASFSGVIFSGSTFTDVASERAFTTLSSVSLS